MTVRDLIDDAASRLKRARIPEPRLEAESLLAFLLKRDLAWLLAHADAPVAKSDGRQFLRQVEKRTRHVPFAQIVGEKGFYGRTFLVTKDVLIPRPETELLIEAVLPFLSSRAKRSAAEGSVVIDLGTGSGAIGLTLAAEVPNAKVILYDVSVKALAVARANARRLKLGRRIRLAKLDILKKRLPEPPVRIDAKTDGRQFLRPTILVANLPYLPLATWKSAQPEVRMHEPKLALVSGKDGLDHYRALFKNLVRWKRPPKLLALEAEPGQFDALAALAREAMPDARVEILKDLHGDERVLLARNA